MSGKSGQYKKISNEILTNIGGKDNIVGLAHCATRLRIVLEDNDLADLKKIEDIDLVKGVFIAGDQLQIIFGAGLVNDIYRVFSKLTGTENMTLSDVKTKSASKQNPLQRAIKSLSDVFIEIMPGILAAALLMGITGLLGQKGLFGHQSVVEMYPALQGINRFVQIISSGIFTLLPLIVAYSATKRYGGRPVLGLVIGAIMLHPDLSNAYDVAQGKASPEIVHIVGIPIELVGFQGGIIIALMMGYIVSQLDKFFLKKTPDMLKLFLAPLLTVFISALLLFTVIGPVGRGLAEFITSSLLWMTQHLGIFGFMFFAGIQQIIVITGLHHVIGAVEAQLLTDTGKNFINPLMSVALMGQGGAVLGFILLNRKDNKIKQIGWSAFSSVFFGVSEPAIFGITLKYKFPLVTGCIAGAVAGAYVYLSKLTAIGFGATALPGFAIVSANNHGHLNYIIAHLIALFVGAILTVVYGGFIKKKNGAKIQDSKREYSKKIV